MNGEKKKARKIWPVIKFILSFLLLLVGLLFVFGVRWLFAVYGEMSFDQILFHMLVPLEGAESGLIWDFIIKCVPISIVVSSLVLFVFFLEPQQKNMLLVTWKARTRKISLWKIKRFLHKYVLVFAIIIMLVFVTNAAFYVGLPAYIKDRNSRTTLYEDEYVDPSVVHLQFPKNPRNVIIVFMESMEVTYTSQQNGGAQRENYIPNLTQIAKENVSFSAATNVGGTYDAAGYTTAGLFTQLSGLPLKIDGHILNENAQNGKFMPGVTMLGDILEEQGYNQQLLIGSEASFGSREAMFTEHGDYQIFDYTFAIDEGYIPIGYRAWWGFEDVKLFDFAKDEIVALVEEDEPFCFVALTADTHHIDGYVCPLCEDQYADQYSNVIACSDRQVSEFVGWIQEQDFYEDTTVVLLGDHKSMNAHYFEEVTADRLVYNAFINGEASTISIKNKVFTSYDIFPTILAAMGVEIEGDQLALGVNLFSDKLTLAEKYGLQEFMGEISKNSFYYWENLADSADYENKY